jgi:hypothetical protein
MLTDLRKFDSMSRCSVAGRRPGGIVVIHGARSWYDSPAEHHDMIEIVMMLVSENSIQCHDAPSQPQAAAGALAGAQGWWAARAKSLTRSLGGWCQKRKFALFNHMNKGRYTASAIGGGYHPWQGSNPVPLGSEAGLVSRSEWV